MPKKPVWWDDPKRSTKSPTSRSPGPKKTSTVSSGPSTTVPPIPSPSTPLKHGPAKTSKPDVVANKSGKSLPNWVKGSSNKELPAWVQGVPGGEAPTASGGVGGGSSGGSSKGYAGGGGSGGAAAPEPAAFQDPYAAIRSALQGAYLGNGADNQGVQAYLQKLAQDAAARTQGYSADAAAQSKAAGEQIAGNLAQSEAARKAAVAAQMNDLIAQGGQAMSGGLAQVDAQGQSQLAGQSASTGALTGRMAEIFAQQSADRLAGVQNTGQYAQGQAAANYSKMLGQVDMASEQARQQFEQMQAAAAGGGGGGGRGGRGGGSGAGGLGTYQDTNTRTLTNNQTNISGTSDEDQAVLAQQEVWQGLSPADKAAVQAIQTYAVFPELAQAQGVDLKKISKSNPNAFNYWMQVQGNEFGYPYQKSTSSNTSSSQQYNRDSSVQTSKYTSPKVKGPAPVSPGKTTKKFF